MLSNVLNGRIARFLDKYAFECRSDGWNQSRNRYTCFWIRESSADSQQHVHNSIQKDSLIRPCGTKSVIPRQPLIRMPISDLHKIQISKHFILHSSINSWFALARSQFASKRILWFVLNWRHSWFLETNSFECRSGSRKTSSYPNTWFSIRESSADSQQHVQNSIQNDSRIRPLEPNPWFLDNHSSECPSVIRQNCSFPNTSFSIRDSTADSP